MESPPLFWDQTESRDPFANRRHVSACALPISSYTCHLFAHTLYLNVNVGSIF